MLALRGKGLNTTSVELCIFVSNQVAYRQLWSAAGWASDETRPAGPTSRQRSLRGDSLVRSAVDTVIQTSFTPFRFESEDPTQGWDSDFQNPFAPIAYTLKQYDYRAAHRLPLAIQLPHVPMEDGSTPGVSLPARVCDSLYRAPVDSQTVRSLVQRLAGEHAPTFSFSLGGELLVEIVWDRLSRRFLLARG